MKSILPVLLIMLFFHGPAYAAKGDRATVTLGERSNSGVTGRAALADNGNGTTTVTVELRDFPEGARNPVHLHEGVCTGTFPTVRYPLNDVVDGRSKTVIDVSLDSLSQEKLFVNVHQSAKEIKTVIACGGVSMPGTLPDTGGGGSLGFTFSMIIVILAGLILTIGVLVTGRASRSQH